MMKGVILGIAPEARLVDLTHEVPPQDLVAGAHLLASAVPYFPPGTIHLAVVDPGVGTRRRALLVETPQAFFVAPDNGLLTLAAADVVRVVDVSRSRYRRRPVSRTFHGRDVFAPVAAHLAAGVAPGRLGRVASGTRIRRLRLPGVSRRPGRLAGEVLWIDRFGNLISSIRASDLTRAGFRGSGVSVRIAGHVVRLRHSYASAPAGRLLALVNSADHLEIALRDGSAAAALGVGRGARVVVEAR